MQHDCRVLRASDDERLLDVGEGWRRQTNRLGDDAGTVLRPMKTRYDILYTKFLELRFAVAQLSDTSDGMKSIDTQESAKRFHILVQDIDILHDQEVAHKRARVAANARRQDLLTEQLVLCGEDLKTLLKVLGELLAKLRPFSGEVQ